MDKEILPARNILVFWNHFPPGKDRLSPIRPATWSRYLWGCTPLTLPHSRRIKLRVNSSFETLVTGFVLPVLIQFSHWFGISQSGYRVIYSLRRLIEFGTQIKRKRTSLFILVRCFSLRICRSYKAGNRVCQICERNGQYLFLLPVVYNLPLDVLQIGNLLRVVAEHTLALRSPQHAESGNNRAKHQNSCHDSPDVSA